MLGDQHVKNSPLRVSVAEMQAKDLGSELLEETDKVSAWLQNLHLPAQSPASPSDPFLVVGDTSSDVRDQGDKEVQNATVAAKGEVNQNQNQDQNQTRSGNMAKSKMKNEGHLLVTNLPKKKPFPKVFSIKDGDGEGELKNPIGLC